MDYRYAELSDIPALAEAYAQLEIDEGSPDRTAPSEIEKLFWNWLGGEHRVVLFERDKRLTAYALYLPQSSNIELQQFFVRRDLRGTGAAKEAFELLREEVWPARAGVIVEARWNDPTMLDFWRSLGFLEKQVRLELDGAKEPAS